MDSEPATERLRLRGHRFLSDDQVELDFEGMGVPDASFVATRREHDGMQMIDFDADFGRLYLGVPCLGTGTPYGKFVGALFAARDVQLPAGAAWQRAFDECVADVSARFTQAQVDD